MMAVAPPNNDTIKYTNILKHVSVYVCVGSLKVQVS